MVKLILHAGFPKCGSTSIFTALRQNLPVLNRQNVHVLDKTLRPQTDPAHLQPPLWELQNAFRDPEKSGQVRSALRRTILDARPGDTLILSTENMSTPAMARMFAGLDTLCEIAFVFYFRPQIDWIPSGWKQWNLKEGISLSETVDGYLERRQPDYLRSALAWQEALPGAAIIPRMFLRERLEGGDPALDFFHVTGIEGAAPAREGARSNPSVDYALMHLMMRNSGALFRHRHDNAPLAKILDVLPETYKKTNAPMLTQAQSDRISDGFRDDNLSLMRDFMGLETAEAETWIARHFYRTVPGRAYGDLPEAEIMDRAGRILREVTGRDGTATELLFDIVGKAAAGRGREDQGAT